MSFFLDLMSFSSGNKAFAETLLAPLQEVVSFCRKHLTANAEAFRSDRLNLVINCARSVQAALSFQMLR